MSKLTEKLEMGFISPTGEWIPAPFCEHESKALEILKKLNYKIDLLGYATDTVIEKFGYILIDGIRTVDVQIPNLVTEEQKICLSNWLVRNKRFIKYMSMESINNLRRCIDWLDEGIRIEEYKSQIIKKINEL